MPEGVTESRLQQRVGRLVIGQDGEDFVLGRPDLGIYVCVPEPGAVLVTALQRGATLAEATARASESAGEEVDGADFVAGLGEAGLLDEPDTDGAPVPGKAIRWIEVISPAVARRLFGRPAQVGYAFAAAYAIMILVLRPELRPTFEDVWFLPDPAASLLCFFPFSLLLTALHETGHWIAGRSLGVPAIFRVSRRGLFLVFETDLTQLVTVPRSRRYRAYLAGVCVDAVVLATALTLRLAYREDLLPIPPIVDRLLGVVVLSLVTTVSWQAVALFLRNDGYAILATALGCHNLYRATWLTTKDRLRGLNEAEAAELAAISPHDRRVARWFGVTYLASLLGMVWLAVTYAIPNLVGMGGWVLHGVVGEPLTTLAFWESAALLALLLVQVCGPALLAARERRARRRGRLL